LRGPKRNREPKGRGRVPRAGFMVCSPLCECLLIAVLARQLGAVRSRGPWAESVGGGAARRTRCVLRQVEWCCAAASGCAPRSGPRLPRASSTPHPSSLARTLRAEVLPSRRRRPGRRTPPGQRTPFTRALVQTNSLAPATAHTAPSCPWLKPPAPKPCLLPAFPPSLYGVFSHTHTRALRLPSAPSPRPQALPGRCEAHATAALPASRLPNRAPRAHAGRPL
jgi:hypothetical protein